MRKGRSSRRSRPVRPLSGTPRSIDALSTEIESTPPRVVVGIPSSEAPSRAPETLESNVPPTMAKADVAVDVVIPRLAPVTIEEPAVSERPTLPPPASSLATMQTLQEETAAPPAVAPARLAELSASPASGEDASPPSEEEEPAPDTQRSLAPQVLSLDSAESQERIAPRAPAPIVTEREEVVAARPSEPPSMDPDDVSVPPIGDITISADRDPLLAEDFFSEGDVASRLDADADGEASPSDKAARKADPCVVERRVRFARYVKWAVAGAAVVCLAAVGRTAVTSFGSSRSAALGASKQSVVAPPPPVDAVEPKAVVAETPQPVAGGDQADPEAPADAVAAEEGGDAKAEKEKSRGFLERRKIAEAIEAGERAVKLDATDAEAWLILGAAYQEKGSMAQARRAYASCVSDAQTGPRQECAKMLR